MYKIVVDAFGGDLGCAVAVEGAIMALALYSDIEIILAGKTEELATELAKHKYDASRVSICPATEVIDCHDIPTAAIKQKKDSSLVRALQLVAANEAGCIVSAGSTGAVLTGATLIIKRIKGVKRPALAPLLPTRKGSSVMLIDCGANADCKPNYFPQFAVMASAYMQGVMDVESPRVALINNGVEAEKGSELAKTAYPLLAATPVNFVGNCEGREILSGDYDVLVTDGFTGNIVLKSTEGVSAVLMGLLKDELMADKRSKMGALLAKNAFRRLKKKLDYTEYGGAPLLGINGGVIKAHGSSNAKAFCSAIRQARNFLSGRVIEKITEAIAIMPSEE